MVQNPLLALGPAIRFDEIRPGHIDEALELLIAECGAKLEGILEARAPRTYENTMLAYDRLTEKLDFAMTLVGHLEAVVTTPELRAAYNAAQPKLSAFYSSLSLSEPLANAVREFASTPAALALPAPKQRFVEKTVAEFRRAGAYLPPAEKSRLAAIDVDLAEATLRFSQNVVDATTEFSWILTDVAALAGLPKSAVDAARESARSKGEEGYRFTLQAPSYLAVMSHLDDRSVRERMWRAYNTRATSPSRDNRPLLATILGLRKEKANLLGYLHFADLVLEDRMAKSAERARAFVRDLHAKTKKHFERENAELARFAKDTHGVSSIEPWDVAYYAEKLRLARFDFDEELLRPYFALDRVLTGLFELAHRLYDIRIVQFREARPWHRDVTAYQVHDLSGQVMASFYVDAYPREGKRDGAWMNGIFAGVPRGGAIPEEHVGVLCMNATPALPGQPALLTHRDVETLFHEFGHLLHHVLSKVDVRMMAGTNVAWDFVELPSQIMENWTWEREALDLFARHYETGETIPDDLLARLKKTRTYRAANAQMRQLGFAETDLALHVDYVPDRDGDPVRYARAIAQKYAASELPDDYAMVASFGHLFGSPVGYAGGYYSYKWAEVLEADAFRRFVREGIFDAKVGRSFRDDLLAKGDTEDPMALFVRFAGHEPDPAALLERSGLLD